MNNGSHFGHTDRRRGSDVHAACGNHTRTSHFPDTFAFLGRADTVWRPHLHEVGFTPCEKLQHRCGQME